jgi:exodeoxyribonuclease-5
MKTFSSVCLEQLPYHPTGDQKQMFEKLEAFLSNSKNNGLFILKGSAGTGKTTLISLLVNNLSKLGLKSLLLAPTGRAAKVMSAYSGHQATTIHRKIYSQRSSESGVHFLPSQNLYSNTIFIIDEASMIADISNDSVFLRRNLLEDIIDYVYSGNGCKIIFSGDIAQLPPVGYNLSPALDENYLKVTFNLIVDSYTLNEVVRQTAASGILFNAENLRGKMDEENVILPVFSMKSFQDICRIHVNDTAEALNSHCRYGELDDTIIVTRSNKMANLYNRQIRARILFRENEMDVGDRLMVLKNNYFWLPKESKVSFIANGDIIEILRIKKTEEMYNLRFADISVRITDYSDETDIDVKIILDSLMTEGPALPKETLKEFYQEIIKDYSHISTKQELQIELRKNPWYNALQVKFAYALTCHKTQGGQWKNVFVDQGFISSEKVDKEYLRWLYTAITRASEKVYLVNFKDEFFD